LKIEKRMKRKKENYFDWDQMVMVGRKVEEGFALALAVVVVFLPPLMKLLRVLIINVVVIVYLYRWAFFWAFLWAYH